MAKQGRKPKPVKPRLPLPQKPPKREPKSNAYTRTDKHKRDWEDERDNDAVPAEEDK